MSSRRKSSKLVRGATTRPAPTRTAKPYVLIVCEGGKTEPNYFHAWRKKLHLPPNLIEIVPGNVCGSNPINIVRHAKQRHDELKKDIGGDIIVWCVFDRDTHDHDNFHNAMKMATDNGFDIALSNPRFELWYLLHFKDQTREIDGDKAHSALKKYLKDYDKNADVFDRVQARTKLAAQRAVKLRKFHKDAFREQTSNPSTKVDLLVKKLQSISRM